MSSRSVKSAKRCRSVRDCDKEDDRGCSIHRLRARGRWWCGSAGAGVRSVSIATVGGRPGPPRLIAALVRPGVTFPLPRSRAAWSGIAALGAVAVAARLPQLLSPNLLAEGDESLVGLMAMHVARGHDVPLFFYGQKYGLAVVEVSAAALSFALFGAGPVTLKAPMLAIWIAGAAFYFRAFPRVLGVARAFWITLVLVLMPAWGVTSMKAWSGYVTAFAATGLVIDLITRNQDRRAATCVAAGAVTAIVYLAQPLWLPGLLPIVVYHLVVSRRVACWTAYACGTVVPIAAMAAVTHYWLAGA